MKTAHDIVEVPQFKITGIEAALIIFLQTMPFLNWQHSLPNKTAKNSHDWGGFSGIFLASTNDKVSGFSGLSGLDR